MSIHSPPTLMKPARQALLRNEAVAISALQKLPWTLFPALFKDAFNGRHTRIVKAMVAAWPFLCLPVGALMNTFNLEMVQEMLDGLDVLLTQNICPRNLKTPLESFSVTHCRLFQPHLKHLSRCEQLHQLKHLDMCGVPLSRLRMKPLRVLLEKVANTLETLGFQGCGIKDSQLSVLLPALSQCSQLTKVDFYFNDFSVNVLSDLLRHTANFTKMTVEQYPIPLECYDEFGCFSRELVVQLCPELMDTLRAIRQPKDISFAAVICGSCLKRRVYDLEGRVCPCLQ
ncbi:oogenesin-3-like [Peromyscus eremicus]|uniref:oogenesin-3-like n=1 Tax=Peromyscus eremicus TaxID=42410 RepID=UPI0027DAE1CD|nr:oogenesin-3-like [Peromyscus eremicus]